MFENEKVYVSTIDEEVHVSRIIASWRNIAKRRNDIKGLGYESIYFEKWMNYIGLSEENAEKVYAFATCGKMELEHAAVKYLNRVEQTI